MADRRDDPQLYVTLDQCQRVSTETNMKLSSLQTSIGQLDGKISGIAENIQKDHDTLYGQVKLGTQEGGLVNIAKDMQHDIKAIKDNNKAKLTHRDAIIVALISGTFALIGILINILVGR